MNYPMITWCIIVAVLLSAFIYRAIEYHCTNYHGHHCGHKATPFIEIGREADTFYIPGDDEIPGIADKEDDSEDQ
mgnify:CR=1 FL=1